MRILNEKIKITEIKVSEHIRSRNIFTNKDEYNKVLQTMQPVVPGRDQIEIYLKNGTSVHTSINHPTLVYRHNIWNYVLASELVINDICYTVNGASPITKLNNINIDTQFADFSIEKTENYYAGQSKEHMMVVHNSATLHTILWHYEIEDILVLKNNKGTEDNRVRKLDYSIQINGFLYKKLINNEPIMLFSPHEVPDMYDAFFIDQEKFAKLYDKYSNSSKIKKKKEISSKELFALLGMERGETGRIYIMNVDHVNTHGAFKDPVTMSNLCVSGDTLIDIIEEGISKTIKIKDLNIDNDIKVLSKDLDTNKLEYSNVLNFDLTRKNASILKITDINTGKYVKCTKDHKIYTKNRGYIKAIELNENDILDIV